MKRNTKCRNCTKVFYRMRKEARGINLRLYINVVLFVVFLGEETDGLSGDGQEVLVAQGSQRLIKQLLGDSLGEEGGIGVKISAIAAIVALLQ